MRNRAHVLFLTMELSVMMMTCAAGSSKAEPGPQLPAGVDQDADSTDDNNGNDLTRPQNSLQLQPNWQASDAKNLTSRFATILQIQKKITFGDWKVALLSQVPFIANTTRSPTDASFSKRTAGIGDAIFQNIVARQITDRLGFGVGARLIARTAGDNLGSGKWQIVPGFGVRYSLPELGKDSYVVPAARYAASFAGDPERRTVREWQIAPTLNIDLPDRYFATFYPSYDIRINEGPPVAGQTGRLFLPFDALVGRVLTDKIQISLEASVPIIKSYPVYDFKTQARLRIIY